MIIRENGPLDLDRATLDALILPLGFGSWGALAYHPSMQVLPCKRAADFPEGMRSVLLLTLPYLADRTPGTISKYARGADYHRVSDRRMTALETAIADRVGKGRFVHFCDISPFDETTLALRAGLGCRGRNGRLITPRYGSYVFLGAVVTDLLLPTTEVAEIPSCKGCGLCIKSCPGGALSSAGVAIDRCLSELSQRKGELSAGTIELMRAHRIGWGCDICQDVCPMNVDAERTTLPEFLEGLTPNLQEEVIAASRDRAYGFRGKAVLRRNLELLESVESD